MPKFRNLLSYLLLAVFSMFYVFPVAWLVKISYQYQVDIFSISPKWLFNLTWDNYRNVLENSLIGTFLVNSLIIASGTTLSALAISLLAAYAGARFKNRLTGGFILSLFLLRMLPGVAVVVPIYLVAANFGLTDSYLTLILVHICVVMPVTVLMLQNFILEVPKELEEAAMADGCSRAKAFIRVVLPLMKPGIIAAAVMSFLLSWNEFLFSMTLSGNGTQTLPVGVMVFMADKTVNWGEIAAMGVIMILPVVLFTLFVQKYLIKGLTMGAVKG